MKSTSLITRSALFSSVGLAASAYAQVPMEPIGATLRYEVALPGGSGGWGSSVTINPGDRVEWRAVVSFTGTQPAVALGRIYYQPVLSNADNTGSADQQDRLGDWRPRTTIPPNGDILTQEEGQSTNTLWSYGRVTFGFTSRSTNPGGSGALTGIRHSAGSNGAPPGEHIRIAGSFNTNWYPPSIPNGTVPFNNQILWGVVSDNNTPSSTFFYPGTQNLTILRQAFIASTDFPQTDQRTVTIFSEAATLQRAGGSAGTDDTRFMTWAIQGEGGSNATARVGVEYTPATVIIVPSPSGVTILLLFGSAKIRVRRDVSCPGATYRH